MFGAFEPHTFIKASSVAFPLPLLFLPLPLPWELSVTSQAKGQLREVTLDSPDHASAAMGALDSGG